VWLLRVREFLTGVTVFRENEGLRDDRDVPTEERVRMIAENNAQIRWLAKGARARARGCAGR